VVRDLAVAFLVLCVCMAAGASAQNKRGRLEDHPDSAWVEKLSMRRITKPSRKPIRISEQSSKRNTRGGFSNKKS
jgi:hypothetical protein